MMIILEIFFCKRKSFTTQRQTTLHRNRIACSTIRTSNSKQVLWLPTFSSSISTPLPLENWEHTSCTCLICKCREWKTCFDWKTFTKSALSHLEIVGQEESLFCFHSNAKCSQWTKILKNVRYREENRTLF